MMFNKRNNNNKNNGNFNNNRSNYANNRNSNNPFFGGNQNSNNSYYGGNQNSSNPYYGNNQGSFFSGNNKNMNNSYYGGGNQGSYDRIYNSYNGSFRPKKKKDINWKLIIKISVIVLIAIVVLVIVLYLYNHKDEIKEKVKGTIEGVVNSQTVEVKLLETAITINVGETRKIKYEILNANENNPVKISSSNLDVVTVDNNGNLKGIKSGNAVITITYKGKDGDEVKVVNVTVISNVTPAPAVSTPIPQPATTPRSAGQQKEELLRRAREKAEQAAREEAMKKIKDQLNHVQLN